MNKILPKAFLDSLQNTHLISGVLCRIEPILKLTLRNSPKICYEICQKIFQNRFSGACCQNNRATSAANLQLLLQLDNLAFSIAILVLAFSIAIFWSISTFSPRRGTPRPSSFLIPHPAYKMPPFGDDYLSNIYRYASKLKQ